MTLKQAFEQLTTKRNWHEAILGLNPATARSIRKRFTDGEMIADEKVKALLQKAGYRVVTEEQWEKLGEVAAEPTSDIQFMLDVPDEYFGKFVGWQYLHRHMYPKDVEYMDMMRDFDIYMKKLKIQEAELKSQEEA